MTRPVLSEISININRRKELSLSKRVKLVTASEWGGSLPELVALYSTPKTTIWNTIQKSEQRENEASLPRSGRPKKFTDRDYRLLLRMVRLQPKLTY